MKLTSELSLAVQEMPTELWNAMTERGHGDGEVMTMKEAFAEYTAWHLGDKAWGYDFAYFADVFQRLSGADK